MLLTPDFDSFFATPAINHAAMCPAEWEHELRLMVRRSPLADAFISGEITPDQFEMGLDEHRIDVMQAREDWSEGLATSERDHKGTQQRRTLAARL